MFAIQIPTVVAKSENVYFAGAFPTTAFTYPPACTPSQTWTISKTGDFQLSALIWSTLSSKSTETISSTVSGCRSGAGALIWRAFQSTLLTRARARSCWGAEPLFWTRFTYLDSRLGSRSCLVRHLWHEDAKFLVSFYIIYFSPTNEPFLSATVKPNTLWVFLKLVFGSKWWDFKLKGARFKNLLVFKKYWNWLSARCSNDGIPPF